MQIILHAGAHFTDDDRLIRVLLKNTGALTDRKTSVPGPGRYRNLLKTTLNAMRDSAPADTAREVLVDAILDGQDTERLILSNSHFFCAPRAALRFGLIYPAAVERLSDFQQLFPGDRIELYLALRNPATFLPAIFTQSPRDGLADFMDGVDPRNVLWSTTIEGIRTALPHMPITLWCNEDTPFLWTELIRDVAGLGPREKIKGGYDFLADLMSKDGMTRFRDYMQERWHLSEAQKRSVIAAFLDKFALEEAIVEELDLPGWTDELVEEMTAIYDADVADIQAMPGVRFLVA